MKFAHLADCHIGGWQEPKLKELTIEVFEKAIDVCIKENVGFVLISGDLFNTAIPSIDLISAAAKQLRKLREQDIEVYIIPGSHDFSPSGKTMLDVLEKAGLVNNVFKLKDNKLDFTIDKTNVKITGMLGKKGGMERNDYEILDKTAIENESGFKIFMFHTTLTEFKPEGWENVDSEPAAILPENFNYYAGGHPHYVFQTKRGNGILAYPGPLFPNNFKEMEELKNGGFYIVDEKLNIKYIPIKIKEVLNINISGNSVKEIKEKINEEIKKNVLTDKIITLRVEGILETGKISDINFNEIIKEMEKDCFIVLKNTNKLTTKEFEEFKVEGANTEEVEYNTIKKHLGQISLDLKKEDEEFLIKNLMELLSKEKDEGEKSADFESRIIKDTIKTLKLEEVWNAA